jgi:hypothetical protein
LIIGLPDHSVIEKFSDETPIYFAILVEVKDLTAASARVALGLCELRQTQPLDYIQEFKTYPKKRIGALRDVQTVNMFRSFSFKSKSKLRSEEFEKRLDMWKSSIKLLRELKVEYGG